jgi:hypothetical protein
MPASISSLREGLAANLSTINGLRVYTVLTDNPQFPAALISLDRIEFDSTMARGCDSIEFTVTLVVARADDRSAQNKLETYLAGTGATSVKTAVESDVTLGGAAFDARVTAAEQIGTVNSPDGSTYLFVDFAVTVTA